LPLFEYHCTKCGHRFEKIEKFNAEPETACSRCGGPLQRPLTAPALQFKGAGWYVNDYASKGTSTSADKPSADSGAAPAADAKPSTESKPASESKPAATESSAKPASTPSTSSTTS
jgi:putative FmdB family regulatory protein